MNVGTKKGFSWDNDNDHDRTPVGRPALSLISVGVQRRNGTVDVGGSGCWGKGNKQTRTNGQPAQQGDIVQATRIQHGGKPREETSHKGVNVNILRKQDK